MGQIWKFRNKALYLWPVDFGQGQLDGKESFQQMELGQLDIHILKNERRPLPHTLQKVIQNGSEALM